VTVAATDSTADRKNAEYWDMLCGWALAQDVELTGDEVEDLRRFDAAYLDYYPYLLDYIDPPALRDKDVLEIGLGYGTLSQLLALAGARYVGLDVAQEPVALLERRIASLGDRVTGRAIRGSALALPLEDESFDYVYSIGCLHHTGNLPQAVQEVHRVLRPGGTAIVMVYYSHSIRHLVAPLRRIVDADWRRRYDAKVRALYDTDPSGAPPPHTEYADHDDVRRLFAGFGSVSAEVRNFPEWMIRGLAIRRTWFLDNIASRIGLDVYITAVK
jgi:SAM-dependent methyltransferase